MTRPDLTAIYQKICAEGVPLHSIEFTADHTFKMIFFPDASKDQRALAYQIATGWDQEAVDAAQAAAALLAAEAKAALPSADDIQGASKVADLKTMALALRNYIDERM